MNTVAQVSWPVICKLDNITYERAAITKWLQEKRTSPMTRAEMTNSEQVSDVLIPNKTLRDLIESETEKYPELLDQKYHASPSHP